MWNITGGFAPITCSHRDVSRLVVLLRFDIHFVYILYINDQGLPVIIALSKPQMLCFMVKLNFV